MPADQAAENEKVDVARFPVELTGDANSGNTGCPNTLDAVSRDTHDSSERPEPKGRNAFCSVIEEGNVEIVRSLLERGWRERVIKSELP